MISTDYPDYPRDHRMKSGSPKLASPLPWTTTVVVVDLSVDFPPIPILKNSLKDW